MKYTPIPFYILLLLVIGLRTHAQTDNPYHLNGRATQENCNCYTLTPDVFNESGSLWNIYKIDLNNSFDFKFNVFLGCADDGADGIVFVLQPVSTSIGSTGGGLGYEGISPSIGIAIDTWRNSEDQDPAYDHIAIHRNGDIDHNSINNLAGPVSAIDGKDNIEDCQWHTFRIIWESKNKKIKTEIDGKKRLELTIDLINDVFSGDPQVFWGFTGATGGAKNLQKVCTSLNPSFSLADNQITCYPEPIQFTDSSTSFGSIVKWFWDFGDGTIDSVQTPAAHVFPSPGQYNVGLRILGNNGCLSDEYKKTIIAGSKPVAGFSFPSDRICGISPIQVSETSSVEFGTINKWNWNINGNIFSAEAPGEITPVGAGQVNGTLQVKTAEGCVSDIASSSTLVLPRPRVDFSFSEACANTPAGFTANNFDPAVPIQNWLWDFGDGQAGRLKDQSHVYTAGGKYPVTLLAFADNGCLSEPVTKDIQIYSTNAFAGHDTVIAVNQPLQLTGSGGAYYSWSPSTGLNDPNVENPVAILQHDMRYILTVSSPEGCASSDTLNIKVYKGPSLYVPNAFSPNGDGKNDKLYFVAAGIATIDFFRIYNRNGQLVYDSPDRHEGWDGAIGGHLQDAGTFVWMIQGTGYTGKKIFKKGTVTLFR